MQGVLLLLIALSVTAAAFTVLSAFSDSGRDQLAKRARTLGVTDRRKRLPRPGPQLRRDRHSSLDLLLHRLVPRPNVLRARLNSSGTGLTIGTYGLLCLAVALVAIIVLLVKSLPALPGILLGLTLGLWLPHVAIGFLIGLRRKRFLKLLPQAIGLLVRGLKAGLPVTETMLVIGREVGDPIGEEFRRIGDQVKLGQSLEDALWSVARRYDLPEFNFLVITLSVQRETGGNLAETLGNLDEILRKRQQMHMKVKAMSSEAKASAGIIGSLPFIMMAVLYSVSHDYVMMLFTTALGHIMLVGGGISMAIGVFVMMQMTRFEI